MVASVKRKAPRLSAIGLCLVFLTASGETSTSEGPTPPELPPPGPPPPSGPPPPPSGARYTIGFSTYLGGAQFEEIREPVALADGSLLFGARTLSADMPTTAGAVQPGHGGGTGDSYLAILSPDGSVLLAATYFGGSGMERPPYGIDVAPGGDIVFGSGTTSPNLPTSANAYRRSLHTPVPSPGDGYVCRISGDLSTLRWCTYTGGGWPRGGLMLDEQENVLVAGRVTGAGFSTTPGVVQTEPIGRDDGFVLKFTADGTDAVFSTRIGGNGTEVGEVVLSLRTARDRTILISGISTSTDFPTTPAAAQRTSTGPKDAFLARLTPDGGSLIYSTLLGGGSVDLAEHRQWLLEDGSVLLSGVTSSADLPGAESTLQGPDDGFLARLDPSGSAFDFVRYFGGPGREVLLSPVVDSHGNIYVVGSSGSAGLPTTADALQPLYGGGATDGVLLILGPDGSTVVYLTYLGGSGDELIRGIAIGPDDEVFLVGRTDSPNFPVTVGSLQSALAGDVDGFVTKLELAR